MNDTTTETAPIPFLTVGEMLDEWRKQAADYGRDAMLTGSKTDQAAAFTLNTCIGQLQNLVAYIQHQTADAYHALVQTAVEKTCEKRLAEIEGRAPTPEEVQEHLQATINTEDGRTAFGWKGQIVCIFRPAGYAVGEGWHDASVQACYPVTTEPEKN